MKKRIISFILFIALTAGTLCAAAAAGGLGNFTRKNTFTDKTFTDVPESEWYWSDVKRVFELGLVEGVGGGKFDPQGTVTVAEAVTLACRLHSIYHTGKAEFEILDPWYAAFVDYAAENGIVKQGEYTDFDRPATRYEYGKILAAALPASALSPINSVSGIPDLANTPENAPIYTLYNAGILMGNDAYGTFAPETAVGRNEIAAIIARMADPACRKTFTLKKAITQSDYLTRKLSDAQLAALKNADLATLRRELSTIPDVVAYLDQFNASFYTAMRVDMDVPIDLGWWFESAKGEWISPDVYTFIALYCISDDFEGINAIEAVTEADGDYWLVSGLALPVKDGYLIYSPGKDSAIKHNNNCVSFNLNTVTVPNFEGIEKHIGIMDQADKTIYRIYRSPADEFGLFFDNSQGLKETTGKAVLIWEISEKELKAAREQKIERAWNHMTNSWESYGLAPSMEPTLTKEQAKALVGKSIDEAAEVIKTVGDCMLYYCVSGFEAKGADLQKWVSRDFWWHYNYAPEQVFEHNYGCCGSISGLTAYLLRGDYETSGTVSMTFAAGEGGGHVINYIYDGSRYYIFDMINWVSSYYGHGLNMVSGATLGEASGNWERATTYWNEKLIVAYEVFDGDMPVGWEWQTSYVTYIPDVYKDTAVILLETPSEGYVYRWVTVPNDVWNGIVSHRTGK